MKAVSSHFPSFSSIILVNYYIPLLNFMEEQHLNIAIPSRPETISETNTEGTYVISGLHPGYGNTLGNALRRMLLSSIPGVAITTIRVQGVSHEFATIEGVLPDVLTIILNIKNIRILANTDVFPQTIKLAKKGVGVVTAGDFDVPAQLKIANKDLVIAEITDAKKELHIEADVQTGVGFRSREELGEGVAVGSIAVDAIFSPVKRSSYDVQNMRVGNRTDFNRLSVFIETDGTITPREALEKALRTMISQFEAMLLFQEGESEKQAKMAAMEKEAEESTKVISIKDLELSASVLGILEENNILTVMDVLKKGVSGIQELPGIGSKAIEEVKARLEARGVVLKE